MNTYKFCYHWASFGGTGYVLAQSAEQARTIVQAKYPKYDETPVAAVFTLSAPINN